jgi:hypothetical protein
VDPGRCLLKDGQKTALLDGAVISTPKSSSAS